MLQKSTFWGKNWENSNIPPLKNPQKYIERRPFICADTVVTNMEMQKMQIFKTEIAKKSLFSSSFPREEFLILRRGNAKYTLNLLHLSLFLVNPSPASVC